MPGAGSKGKPGRHLVVRVFAANQARRPTSDCRTPNLDPALYTDPATHARECI